MIVLKRIKKFLYKIIISFASSEQYIQLLRGGGVKIGSDCAIHKSVVFGTEPYLISIGNHVRITDGVKFITHDGGIWVARYLGMVDERADLIKEIKIGNNVHIGWNTLIMPGVSIGNNCIIGAGAVVTKDIPDNSIAVGIPAKVVESINEYVDKNKSKCLLTKNLNVREKKKVLLDKISFD